MIMLKLFLWFLIFYVVFRLSIKFLLPFVFKKVGERILKNVRQTAQGGQGQQGGFYYQYRSDNPNSDQARSSKSSGKVSIVFDPHEEKHNRKGTATAGEFVDFEEVK